MKRANGVEMSGALQIFWVSLVLVVKSHRALILVRVVNTVRVTIFVMKSIEAR